MAFLLAILFSFLCFYFAKKRIVFLSTRYQKKPRSLPQYYGYYLGTLNIVITSIALVVIQIFKSYYVLKGDAYEYIAIVIIFFIQLTYIFATLRTKFRAQLYFENILTIIFKLAALLSVFLTMAILLTILFEAFSFFSIVPIEEFLLGIRWSPQSADFDLEHSFGVIPVITGTLLVTSIALVVAIPIGLSSAIYLSEYISPKKRNAIKPLLELLAGIPTIVYGYFAAITMGPIIRQFSNLIGVEASTESALAAGLVLGIMIIPFILTFVDEAIYAVPRNLRDAALALGSTRAEMILKVVVPAASSGIYSAILLAISRAVGETMIVTMASGMKANLTFNPLDSVSTFTAQIVSLLVGDQEFDSPKTLAAFALALGLFLITLFINVFAIILLKGQKKYE